MICNLRIKMNSAIILAAGSGKRTNLKIPKQFVKVDAKNHIISYSINSFKKNKNIHEIIVVVPKDWVNKFSEKFKNVRVIQGGKTRSESSIIALHACSKKTANVLIHDAVRPFISQKFINEIIEKLNKYDAVIPLLDCMDSIVNINDNSFYYLNREKVKYVQTPQGFNYSLIYSAYKNIQENINVFSDNMSTLISHNSKVNYTFIDGESSNFKITTIEDIDKAKILLK